MFLISGIKILCKVQLREDLAEGRFLQGAELSDEEKMVIRARNAGVRVGQVLARGALEYFFASRDPSLMSPSASGIAKAGGPDGPGHLYFGGLGPGGFGEQLRQGPELPELRI